MATAKQVTTEIRTLEQDPAALLDKILEQKPSSRGRIINDSLEKRIQQIEELLPDALKHEAARFVKRAMLTFSRNPKLQECTPASFIKCVLDGAEVGLPIDGKLGHAVPYNCKVKVDGRDQWQMQAQFQPDYKGLVAVARRSGAIVDATGDVVCESDHFEHGRSGAQSKLEHTYAFGKPRGAVVGAYAIITLPNDSWRYELMSNEEIDRIRNRSKAAGSGPWVTDTDQMRIKTVLRRALKLYCHDTCVQRVIEMDEREYETDRHPPKRAERSSLNDALNLPTAGKRSAFEEPPQPRVVPEPTEPQHIEELDQSTHDGSDNHLADVLARIDEARGDYEALGRLNNELLGPESELAADEMDAVREVLMPALNAARTKPKRGKQEQQTLVDTTPDASGA